MEGMSARLAGLPRTAHLVCGVAPDGRYRFVATICTEAAADVARRHGLTGLPAVAIGRGVAAGLCLATLTKGDERVTIQWNGDGALGGVVVDATGAGAVRAYLAGESPGLGAAQHDAARPSVGGLVGRHGTVTVIRDLGLRETYVGQGGLVDGELDTDVQRYLTASEQLDSALGCEVVLSPAGQVRAASGVLVQALPADGEEGVRAVIEEVRRSLRAPTVYELLRRAEPGRLDAAMLVASVVPEGVATILKASRVYFHCGCDGKRVMSALGTLGPAELERLADEKGGAEVTCQFCSELYALGAADVRGLARDLRARLN